MTEPVRTLPFDKRLGWPQRQRIVVAGTTYDLFWRWNYQADYATLEVADAGTGATLWIGKIAPNWPIEIRDPETALPIMSILPRTVDRAGADVWVVW